MAVITAILIICAVACFMLATLVALQGMRQLSHILFVGVSLCFAVWPLGVLLFMQTNDSEVALFASRIYYLAAGAFPPLLLMFSLVYPNTKQKVSPVTTTLVAVAGIAMALAITTLPIFMIRSLTIEGASRIVEIDKATYLLYVAYFVSLFLFAMVTAYRKYRQSTGDVRMQAATYASGILVNSIPGFITNLYLPYFGNYDYIWVGPAASVFFLALTTYGITRHGLFSIKAAAVRSTAYIFTLLTLLGVYYVVAYSFTLIFPQENALVSLTPVNMLIALILAVIFQPVKRFFDKFTNKVFFRDFYSTEDFFARITRSLTSSTDLAYLLARVSREIAETVKSEQVYFSVNDEDDKVITIGTGRHGSLPRDDVDSLRRYAGESDSILVADELEPGSHLIRLMASHRLAIVMPLFQGETFVGLVCIGRHKASRYTRRDVKALRAIADELVIAIQNAMAVERIRDLNAHLEQRVNSATRELRHSNAQLQKLDEAKDEFISMASHQLRTPLTSIKGYISMLMEGDVGKISDEQKRVLQEVFVSSERMVRLIGDFLNVSRLQTGKFIVETRPVDLATLVQREIEGLIPSASSRGLSFVYKKPKNIPLLNLDENKIQQVVMNFSDNAVYYSREGSKITLTLKKVPGAVEFTVKDTGIGVPIDEQAGLFNKFFRATNARKQRPDGTGVGLFLAKKVIDDHGGEIIFSSVEGKGSTFGFRLPLSIAAKPEK